MTKQVCLQYPVKATKIILISSSDELKFCGGCMDILKGRLSVLDARSASSTR